MTKPPKPAVTAAWKQALQAGIAHELAWWSREYRGVWGYDPGEIPVYAPCRLCPVELRADRLDLIAEHLADCPGLKASFSD